MALVGGTKLLLVIRVVGVLLFVPPRTLQDIAFGHMEGTPVAVAATSSAEAPPPSLPPSLPAPIVDRLVSIHAKLLQLVEAISEFQRQIEYGGAEGMIGW